MPHRAVAIANAFLKLPGAAETLTQMQLQKLVYIAHGWSLAIYGDRLVSDPVEAWAYGPVYRDLYDHTKYFGKEPIGRLISPDDGDIAGFFLEEQKKKSAPYEAKLEPEELDVIFRVWHRYGNLNGGQLSQLTHQKGTPWFETYTQKGRDQIIPDPLIRSHYLELAERAGQAPEA